ncbi:hypothetical protein [Streptomyces pseudogriseolus]|uniref:hypothetical protein n=1 Tax=Streptomyces pseudogriseolus TaxID=36817 RepID=UPI003490DB36
MSVRPYPSRDRALRQILRRHPRDTPPLPGPRAAGEPGMYVLSTRRPGAVSGPS